MSTTAIYGPSLEVIQAYGQRTYDSFIGFTYDSQRSVRGSSLLRAVLIDPPKPAMLPIGLLQALAVEAARIDVPARSLITIVRAGKEVTESVYDPAKWWCKGCHCPRDGTSCWKCGPGADGYHPVAGLDSPKLPNVNIIRELARTKGYCLAEHGSKERDLDVVAIPWTEDACDAGTLAQYLADNLLTENGPARIIDQSNKPCGRKTYNIQLNGFYKLIDLSITPKGHDGNS